ncbi:hypothetical protein E3E26_03900 [Thermococcus sp. LS1]|uniref:hypothetical protein n=1 Tax=Thermococcus sp. LS1 TaxID=1638259 RepID=UPI00143C0BAD|nr:hypothetical protein [Thermococcus sp. LS1]NJD98932.1 hypothetical protein [Thermococcus sp. LS1]
MRKYILLIFLLHLFLSHYVLADSPEITGIIHYHDGFLVLTQGSANNTTQLWFFEPGKGFKLLNATFPNLTFVHSNGERVLLYRNLSNPYFPDFQLYTYDGKLHFLGNFTGIDDLYDASAIYWNGEFYFFFEIEGTFKVGLYHWYAIVNNSIYSLIKPSDIDKEYSFACTWLDDSCYLGDIQSVPHGYLVVYTPFSSYWGEPQLVKLNGSELVIKNLTEDGLSSDWVLPNLDGHYEGFLCFNGTHFATIMHNANQLLFNNSTVWTRYFEIINLNGSYRLIPLGSIPRESNLSLTFAGTYNGKWIIRKDYWWKPEKGQIPKWHRKVLEYILISSKGIEEVENATDITPVCRKNRPQVVFIGRRPVKGTLKFNGSEVTVNGSVLYHKGNAFKLPFKPKIADCGNGCLLSDGRRLAYFDGNGVRIVEFPGERSLERSYLAALGIAVIVLLLAWRLRK